MIFFAMTEKRALELGLLICICGHPVNNHFDYSNACAHCSCKSYHESGIRDVTVYRSLKK